MDPRTSIIIVIAVAVIALLIVLWAIVRKRHRTVALRQSFGPEYDRVMKEQGATRAEAVLEERQKRVEKFPLRTLAVDERERFISEWRAVQSRFVDDPARAVKEADALVTALMQSRGYPMANFEQRAADISVHYPRVVDNYRAAREVVLRHQRGQASTEDLRNSMIYYRTLFDELLETSSVRMKKEVA
jgi:FtsZ-interacting cell division protein ZipA